MTETNRETNKSGVRKELLLILEIHGILEAVDLRHVEEYYESVLVGVPEIPRVPDQLPPIMICHESPESATTLSGLHFCSFRGWFLSKRASKTPNIRGGTAGGLSTSP